MPSGAGQPCGESNRAEACHRRPAPRRRRGRRGTGWHGVAVGLYRAAGGVWTAWRRIRGVRGMAAATATWIPPARPRPATATGTRRARSAVPGAGAEWTGWAAAGAGPGPAGVRRVRPVGGGGQPPVLAGPGGAGRTAAAGADRRRGHGRRLAGAFG